MLLGWYCQVPAAAPLYRVIKSLNARLGAKSSQCESLLYEKCHGSSDDRNRKTFSSQRKATYEGASRTNGNKEFCAFAAAAANDPRAVIYLKVFLALA